MFGVMGSFYTPQPSGVSFSNWENGFPAAGFAFAWTNQLSFGSVFVQMSGGADVWTDTAFAFDIEGGMGARQSYATEMENLLSWPFESEASVRLVHKMFGIYVPSSTITHGQAGEWTAFAFGDGWDSEPPAWAEL